MNKARTNFADTVYSQYGYVEEITRDHIKFLCSECGMKWPGFITGNPENNVARGVYALPADVLEYLKTKSPETVAEAPEEIEKENLIMEETETNQETGESFVPKPFKGYVPFGNYDDVAKIIESKKFYPMFITGLSGNGKTLMVNQICASQGRELVRANITVETDEDDLLGGFRLANGKTVWQDGPVVTAMKRGAILLLDEVDLASNKIMCLQPVLEGSPIYLKKINMLITPAPGFNIVATANTKGQGSVDGRFVGTMVMNEAFLERFSICFEQEYPAKKTEISILKKMGQRLGIKDKDFPSILVDWADQIRKNFVAGTVNEIISTRRLSHIMEAFAIFDEDRIKSVRMCLNRFDTETRDEFMTLYSKKDADYYDRIREEEEKQKRNDELQKRREELAAAASTATPKKGAGTGSVPF